MMQRATNLEAAYVYNKLNCQQLRSDSSVIYQKMIKIQDPSDPNIADYACWAAKTGCRVNADCHGTLGTYCNAYGQTAFDTGNVFPGTTDIYRTKVRGLSEGKYNEGINKSCQGGLGGCSCNTKWAGKVIKNKRFLLF